MRADGGVTENLLRKARGPMALTQEELRWQQHFGLDGSEVLVEGTRSTQTTNHHTDLCLAAFNCTYWHKNFHLPGKILVFQHKLGFHHKVAFTVEKRALGSDALPFAPTSTSTPRPPVHLHRSACCEPMNQCWFGVWWIHSD